MTDESAVAEKEPVTLPVPGESEASPEKEQPAEPEPQAEEKPEAEGEAPEAPEGEETPEPPAITWEEHQERLKEDEGFTAFLEKERKQARREGQQREAGQRNQTLQAAGAVNQSLQQLNATLTRAQKDGTLDGETLMEAINANDGLRSLMGYTEDQRTQLASTGAQMGMALVAAAFGAHKKYGDPEEASRIVQDIMAFGGQDVLGKVQTDPTTGQANWGPAAQAVAEDYLDDIFQAVADKATAPLKKRIKELESDIEEFKTGVRSSGPDVTSKDSSGAAIKSMADADRLYSKGEITHERYKQARQQFGQRDRATYGR